MEYSEALSLLPTSPSPFSPAAPYLPPSQHLFGGRAFQPCTTARQEANMAETWGTWRWEIESDGNVIKIFLVIFLGYDLTKSLFPICGIGMNGTCLMGYVTKCFLGVLENWIYMEILYTVYYVWQFERKNA